MALVAPRGQAMDSTWCAAWSSAACSARGLVADRFRCFCWLDQAGMTYAEISAATKSESTELYPVRLHLSPRYKAAAN